MDRNSTISFLMPLTIIIMSVNFVSCGNNALEKLALERTKGGDIEIENKRKKYTIHPSKKIVYVKKYKSEDEENLAATFVVLKYENNPRGWTGNYKQWFEFH